MPDESCRKCGGLLLAYTVCGKCRASNRFICRICGTKTLEQIHDLCFRTKIIKKVDIPLIINSN